MGKYEIAQTADGTVIPEPMVNLFTSGRFNRLPVINGTTRTEFHWFQGMLELSTGQTIPADAYTPILSEALATLPGILLGRSVDSTRIADIAQTPPRWLGTATLFDCGAQLVMRRDAPALIFVLQYTNICRALHGVRVQPGL